MATSRLIASAVLLIVAILAQNWCPAAAQKNCSAGLGDLMQCAPYVLPGANAGPPSAPCCAALSAVDTSCLCETLDIISRLPTTCQLPQLSCGA